MDALRRIMILVVFTLTVCWGAYGQGFFEPEWFRTFWGTEEQLKPVLDMPDTVCQGDIVLVHCTNCHPSDGLYWAVQGNATIIRKAGTLVEIGVSGLGPVRVALERENFWGIGRNARSFITLESPAVNLKEVYTVCRDSLASISLDSVHRAYHWSDGSTRASREGLETGIYHLKVTARHGCKVHRRVEVRERPVPHPELGPDRYLCEGQTPALDPGRYATYLWQDSSTLPRFQATSPGTYWVEVSNQCGESGSDTIRLLESRLPPIELGEDVVLCQGDTLKLDAGEAYGSYVWNNGIRGQTLPVWATGVYRVTGADASGCLTSDEIAVEVTRCSEEPVMPLVITPNNDGLNDQFQPLEKRDYSSMTVQVFSPEGLLLYFNQTGDPAFDGQFEGRPLPTGSYPYTLQFLDKSGNQQFQSGRLNIH